MYIPRTAVAVLAIAASVSAQDMLGVTYSGAVVAVDSTTGAQDVLGAVPFGSTCLARDQAGTLWTVTRNLLGTPVYLLTSMDPATLTPQAVHQVNDLRALADAGAGELYAIEGQAGAHLLTRIGTTANTRVVIGPTTTRVEAMTMHAGALYAYSLDEGLGTIDTATGAFTALAPSGPLANVEWLASRADGTLIGGAIDFYEFDPATGTATPYASGPNFLRGADVSGLSIPYGNGCNGIELRCTGSLKAGSVLTTLSTGYPSTGALVGIGGAILLGTSRTSYEGVALPFDLDPFLGTTGCALLTGVDASELALTTGSLAPSLYRPVFVPTAVVGQTFYLQHAGFDFNGGWYWSNGVQVYIGT